MTNDQVLILLLTFFVGGFIFGWGTKALLIKRKTKRLAENPPF